MKIINKREIAMIIKRLLKKITDFATETARLNNAFYNNNNKQQDAIALSDKTIIAVVPDNESTPEPTPEQDVYIPFDEVRAPWMIKLEKAHKIIDELEKQVLEAEKLNAECEKTIESMLKENVSLKSQLSDMDERNTLLESQREYVEYFDLTSQIEKERSHLYSLFAQRDSKREEIKQLEMRAKSLKNKLDE